MQLSIEKKHENCSKKKEEKSLKHKFLFIRQIRVNSYPFFSYLNSNQFTRPTSITYKSIKKINRSISSIGIGVGVFLINVKEKLILVGKRKNGDLLGLPGGWLDLCEDWSACAKRELFEETNLTKSKNEFYHIHTLNCKFTENNYHNISCIMYSELSEFEETKIVNKEPNKCYGWYWASVAYLRENSEKLFYPLRQFLLQFQNILSTDDLKKMID